MTIQIDHPGERADWWDKQQLSVESYKRTHEKGEFEPEEEAVYRLFASFIGSAMKASPEPSPLLLDVGCGIFPDPSPYITGIEGLFRFIGIDPLPSNLMRSYPFICGRLEDLGELASFSPRFDLFVFGTSADHLEDLEAAAAAVRKLAAPGAQAVFWNGLYDPELVAGNHGARVFQRLPAYGSRPAALAAFAGYGLLRLPRTLGRIGKMQRGLREGTPLDDSHFRYFTRENSIREMSVFGEVVEVITLPNTNHSFARVRINVESRDGSA